MSASRFATLPISHLSGCCPLGCVCPGVWTGAPPLCQPYALDLINSSQGAARRRLGGARAIYRHVRQRYGAASLMTFHCYVYWALCEACDVSSCRRLRERRACVYYLLGLNVKPVMFPSLDGSVSERHVCTSFTFTFRGFKKKATYNHSFTHQRQSQPRRVTASSSGASRVMSIQGEVLR